MIEPGAVVFVVDDDPSVRRSTERLLRLAGLKVQTYSSAPEFLGAYRPDLLAKEAFGAIRDKGLLLTMMAPTRASAILSGRSRTIYHR